MNTLLTLQNILREVFDNDELVITPETGAKDIEGWDSVAQVKIVLTIEEQFGIQFSEDEVSSIKTVGGFVAAIEKRGLGGK
jgi:acyl carrier protein